MAHNRKNQLNGIRKTQRTTAFTLVETLIAMSLIAVIFLLVMQAFGSLTLGSFLIDARTSVRNEGEFIGEYLKLRIKNADPRTLKCNNTTKEISWQSKGASDEFTLFLGQSSTSVPRFCIDDKSTHDITCDTVLSYDDVIVKNVDVSCETIADDVTGEQFTNVNLSFEMDSVAKLGQVPAVKDVSRFISVAIR